MFACKVFVAALALALFGSAHSLVTGSGECPCDVQVMPNFNVQKYLGVWYEYAKYPTAFETNGMCVAAEYSLRSDGNVGVSNTMIDATTGKASGIEGYAVPVENAKLKVVFPVTTSVDVSSNYWVLDTDYETYSVVYSCQPISAAVHTTTVWILTRERMPSAYTINIAKAVMARNNLATSSLVLTDQSCC